MDRARHYAEFRINASVLFAERQGQPNGAQERNDYQPINMDFILQDVEKTEKQLKQIFRAFAERSGVSADKFTTFLREKVSEDWYQLAAASLATAFLFSLSNLKALAKS